MGGQRCFKQGFQFYLINCQVKQIIKTIVVAYVTLSQSLPLYHKTYCEDILLRLGQG